MAQRFTRSAGAFEPAAAAARLIVGAGWCASTAYPNQATPIKPQLLRSAKREHSCALPNILESISPMTAYSEFLSDGRSGRGRPAKSRTPWPPTRSGRLQKVLFCGAIAIASCAATVGALTQQSAPAPRSAPLIAAARVAVEAAPATALRPVAVANIQQQEAAVCGDFKASFLNQQCSKFHPSRPVQPHRVATWILAHPAEPMPPSVAVTPTAPPSQPTKTTNNSAERHIKRTAARTEPPSMSSRQRAELALPDRSYE
jgi:hypothetical protein